MVQVTPFSRAKSPRSHVVQCFGQQNLLDLLFTLWEVIWMPKVSHLMPFGCPRSVEGPHGAAGLIKIYSGKMPKLVQTQLCLGV